MAKEGKFLRLKFTVCYFVNVNITFCRSSNITASNGMYNLELRTELYLLYLLTFSHWTCVNIPIFIFCLNPDSKVHGANMGPIWGRQDPGGLHVGPMNFIIWEGTACPLPGQYVQTWFGVRTIYYGSCNEITIQWFRSYDCFDPNWVKRKSQTKRDQTKCDHKVWYKMSRIKIHQNVFAIHGYVFIVTSIVSKDVITHPCYSFSCGLAESWGIGG